MIVRYRPQVDLADRLPLLDRLGVGRTVERIADAGAQVAAVEEQEDPLEVARRLERSPKVAYAEPNFLVQAQGRPNDPRFRKLWGLQNRGQTGGKRGADIRAVKGWRRLGVGSYPGGRGVPVGIVDTGIDGTHPDLRNQVRACAESRPRPGGRKSFQVGQCGDATGHGTHISGIIGAIADNRIGVTGVAFNSPLIVCRALGGSEETGRVSDVARCIGWVRARGARVISMSFAGQRSKTLHRAVKAAWRKGRRAGAVLVSAAGNGGLGAPAYPGSYDEVMSVSATNDHDRIARFSNHHRTIDVAAPGVGILSTGLGGGYTRLSGTSMGVPHVAGMAAQLRRVYPKHTARAIRGRIRRSATDLGPSGHDPRYGHGRANLAKAARLGKRRR